MGRARPVFDRSSFGKRLLDEVSGEEAVFDEDHEEYLSIADPREPFYDDYSEESEA